MKSIAPAVALASLLSAGCIHTQETVVRDEGRVPVEFENDAAARVFYEALSRMPGHENRTEQNTEVSLPVVFSHKTKVVRGPNEGFNRAVRRCDTNQDHRITEAEARIFGATVP